MMTLFEDMCRALELIESEHDIYAGIIRLVLKTPGFDVNTLQQWGNEWRHRRAALHAACGDTIRSHVGAQLLLSDERCDVNLRDGDGRTALMTAVRLVESENDKHAKIVRNLLAHPHAMVNKTREFSDTPL